MNSFPFSRLIRGTSHRAARQFLVVALACSACLSSTAAAPKGGGSTTPEPPPPPADSRIVVGPETTPGDTYALYKITTPGSYVLAGNVLGVAGQHGIAIIAGGVTLDLNGFAVVGVAADATLNSGIYVSYATGPVRVLNGAVSNWSDSGVYGYSSVLQLESLRVSDNGRDGVHLWGGVATLTRCIAEENGRNGFFAVSSTNNVSTITESTAVRNAQDGFSGLSVSLSGAASNGRHGFHNAPLVEKSEARYNEQDGINEAHLVTNNVLRGNRRHGIYVMSSSRVTGNVAFSNGSNSGISGSGIWVAGDGNVISGNKASTNRRGITVTGTHNEIEDNHLTFNSAFGLWCSGQYNLITRNTARNTNGINWSIGANNRAGAFVAPALNGAITGSTGGNGSGTTDPFANLSF